MKKYLLTALLVSLSASLAQAREKKVVEERAPAANLYQPIPRSAADPNTTTRRWRIAVMKPTQHYYTKNGVVSYRYSQNLEYFENLFGGYMGPRSAVFTPQNDSTTTGASARSYANVGSRNMQGVTMAPRTEIPVDKAKKSAKSAETSIQLAQQR
jgi:hypothetical protein